MLDKTLNFPLTSFFCLLIGAACGSLWIQYTATQTLTQLKKDILFEKEKLTKIELELNDTLEQLQQINQQRKNFKLNRDLFLVQDPETIILTIKYLMVLLLILFLLLCIITIFYFLKNKKLSQHVSTPY